MRVDIRPAMVTISLASLICGCAGGSSSSAPSAPASLIAPASLPAPTALGPGIGIATDQPCTATAEAGPQLVPAGYAIHELPPMVLDTDALGLAGKGWFGAGGLNGYTDNQEIVQWGDLHSPDSCEVLVRLHRITGYAATWADDAARRAGTEVHLFPTEVDAAGFAAWLPAALRGPSIVADGQGGTTTIVSTRSEALPELGEEAVLLRVRTTIDERAWAVFRVGNLAGVVTVVGPIGELPVGDPVAAAERLARRMADAPGSGRPQDAVVTMSVPVNLDAWGAAYAGLAWDWWFGGCWTAAETAANATDPAAEGADIRRTGWLGTCAAMYSPPAPSETGITRVASRVTVFADRAGARDYFADALSEYGGEGFDVAGLAGAVGSRRAVDVGYEDTRVWFVRGALIATVFVHDWDERDQRQEVVRVARLLDERLALLASPP